MHLFDKLITLECFDPLFAELYNTCGILSIRITVHVAIYTFYWYTLAPQPN